MDMFEWTIKSSAGLDLYARGWGPTGKPKATIELIHGLGANTPDAPDTSALCWQKRAMPCSASICAARVNPAYCAARRPPMMPCSKISPPSSRIWNGRKIHGPVELSLGSQHGQQPGVELNLAPQTGPARCHYYQSLAETCL